MACKRDEKYKYKYNLIMLKRLFSSQSTSVLGPVCVVVGGTRGIGLSMAKEWYDKYRGIENSHLYLCGRTQPVNNELYNKLIHKKNVSAIKLDLTQEDSIAYAAKKIQEQTPLIDYLINTAGYLHSYDKKTNKPSDIFPNLPERSFKHITMDGMIHTFTINAFASALLIKEFYQGLNQAGRKGYRKLTYNKPPVFAALSARVASITENESGGWTSYRASKTALNMILKNAHYEFRKGLTNKQQQVSFLALHPGTVDTDLSAPFQKMAKKKYTILTPQQSAEKLFHIVTESDQHDSGQFYDYNKDTIQY